MGTFADRLPADMVVTNEKHRDICEKKWNIPSGTIPAKIGLHAVAQDRALKRRQAECLLDHVYQQHAGRAEHQ